MNVSPASAPCPHCGTTTEAGGFCCAGCEVAAALLSEAGLGRYYAERKTPAPRPGATISPVLHATTLENGESELRFHVEGLSCASCVWVAESLLGRVPGVRSATVSYGSHNAVVRFDAGIASPLGVVAPLTTVGWRVGTIGAAPTTDRSLTMRTGFAAFIAMNLMMMSAAVYAGWFEGMRPAWLGFFTWWSLVLATPVATWAALPFYRGALAGIRARRLHVDVPVSIGIATMYLHGLWAGTRGHEGYLDSMVMLVALLLGGRLLEQSGRRRAQEAARTLGKMAPSFARRLTASGVERVDTSALRPGDRLVVAHGDEIAADGIVTEGQARLQLALLTGESEPRAVAPGDEVVAGGWVAEGNLVVRVDRVGEDTLLGRMVRRLAEALDRPIAPTLADRMAPAFTALTLVVAAGAAVIWGRLSGPDDAVRAAIAVLVVACPCALALASPLTTAAALGAAARSGLLVRSGGVLDTMAQVDTVVFDKTGTLTDERPRVTRAADDVLRLAAGLERQSSHPIAQAILDEAAARGIALPSPRAVIERPGAGVVGEVDGRRLSLTRGRRGAVQLQQNNHVLGEIELGDRLRPEADALVRGLVAHGIGVWLLSGDDVTVAARIAVDAGIQRFEGGLTPEDKAARVAALRAAGHTVLFMGDGINDGPALAAADVGVAMGSGAASTIQVADAVAVGGGLSTLASGLSLARARQKAVRGASLRSVVYNVTAVAAAAAGLVNPLVAALLMPLSSAMVVGSALWLGRVRSDS